MSFEDMADAAANPKNLPVEFTFDESLVRTVIKDGEAWFVAKDVCDILEHSATRAWRSVDSTTTKRGTTTVRYALAARMKCSR